MLIPALRDGSKRVERVNGEKLKLVVLIVELLPSLPCTTSSRERCATATLETSGRGSGGVAAIWEAVRTQTSQE